MKCCYHCKKYKDYSEYYLKSGKYYSSRCKDCFKLYVTPEAKAEYDKTRRKIKGEELRAYDRQRASLPHRRAAKNEHTRRRKALLKKAVPKNFDKKGVQAMYLLAQKFTKLTGVEMHVDHIIPLAAGGEHNVDNLQLLAAPLNLAKGSNPHWQLSWKDYP